MGRTESVELVEEFGSPMFMVTGYQIRIRMERFQRAFQGGRKNGPVSRKTMGSP